MRHLLRASYVSVLFVVFLLCVNQASAQGVTVSLRIESNLIPTTESSWVEVYAKGYDLPPAKMWIEYTITDSQDASLTATGLLAPDPTAGRIDWLARMNGMELKPLCSSGTFIVNANFFALPFDGDGTTEIWGSQTKEVPCEVPPRVVEPNAPYVSESICGDNNNVVVVPEQPAGVLVELFLDWADNVWYIRYVPDTANGYYFPNKDKYRIFRFQDAGPCSITLPNPTQDLDAKVCGPNNDPVTIPTMSEGVSYQDSNWSNGVRTITYFAADGYLLGPGKTELTFTFYDNDVPCSLEPVIPSPQERVCGDGNDVIQIPSQPIGVDFDDSGWQDNERTITFFPEDGFTFDGDSQEVVVSYTDEGPCVVEPAELPKSATAVCGDNNDDLTIPAQPEAVNVDDTHWVENARAVTLSLSDSHVFPDGSRELVTSYKDDGPCLVQPAELPESATAVCGDNNDELVIPDQPEAVEVADSRWVDNTRAVTLSLSNSHIFPDGSREFVATYEDAGDCLIELVELPETATAVCGNNNDELTIPHQDEAVAVTDSKWVENRRTITLELPDGYAFLNGTRELIAVYEDDGPCLIEPVNIPAKATRVCGLNNDRLVIPDQHELVTVVIGDWIDNKLSVTLSLPDGYAFPDDTQEMVLNYADEGLCIVTPVELPASAVAVCGHNNDELTLPEQPANLVSDDSGWIYDRRTITLTPAENHKFPGSSQRIVKTYRDQGPCYASPVSLPESATLVCGDDNDTLELPDQPENVKVSDSGWGNNVRTITLTPIAPYVFFGYQQSIPVTYYDGGPCIVTPIELPESASAVCGDDNDNIALQQQPQHVKVDDSGWENNSRTIRLTPEAPFSFAGDAQEIVATYTDQGPCVVTPVELPPSATAVCGDNNDELEIPKQPLNIEVRPGKWIENSRTVELLAAHGFAFPDGEIEIAVTYTDDGPCVVEPVDLPAAASAVCGFGNDDLTLPYQPENVIVNDTGWQDNQRTVTLTPAENHRFDGESQKIQVTYVDHGGCLVTPVELPKEATAVCGDDNDELVLPDQPDGVRVSDSGWVNNTRTITVTPIAPNFFAGESQAIVVIYTDTGDCLVTPEELPASASTVCGDDNDELELPQQPENVTVRDSGWVANKRTITLLPAEGYRLEGDSRSIVAEYTDEGPCRVTPQELPAFATTVCGFENDTLELPVQPTGVHVYDSGWKANSRTVILSPVAGYVFEDDSPLSYGVYTDNGGCEISPVELPATTFTVCGENNDLLELPAQPKDVKVEDSGWLGGTRTITLTPIAPAFFAGDAQKIVATYTDGGTCAISPEALPTSAVAVCGDDNDVLDLPDQPEGVQVHDSGWNDNTRTITLTPEAKYVFEGDAQEVVVRYSDEGPCLVTPVELSEAAAVCGDDNDELTLPNQPDGVDVRDSGWVENSRTITLTPKDGYAFTGESQSIKASYMDDGPCNVSPVELPTVATTVCGGDNDEAELPEQPANVTVVDTGWVDGSRTVILLPAEGYRFEGEAQQISVTYIDHGGCLLISAELPATATAVCGDNNDELILPDQPDGILVEDSGWTGNARTITMTPISPNFFEGESQAISVVYTDDGPCVTTPIELPAAAAVVCGDNNDDLSLPEQPQGVNIEDTGWSENARTITLIPAEGYVFEGDSQEIVHTYTDAGGCEVEPRMPDVIGAVCGPDNDEITIPEQPEGVLVSDSGWLDNERVVSFTAAEGYVMVADATSEFRAVDEAIECAAIIELYSVTIQLQVPDGQSLAGEEYRIDSVSASQLAAAPWSTGVVGDENTIHLAEMPAGTFRLRIAPDGYQAIDFEFEVGGETPSLQFEIQIESDTNAEVPAENPDPEDSSDDGGEIPADPGTPTDGDNGEFEGTPIPASEDVDEDGEKTFVAVTAFPNTGAGNAPFGTHTMVASLLVAMVSCLAAVSIRRSSGSSMM